MKNTKDTIPTIEFIKRNIHERALAHDSQLLKRNGKRKARISSANWAKLKHNKTVAYFFILLISISKSSKAPFSMYVSKWL